MHRNMSALDFILNSLKIHKQKILFTQLLFYINFGIKASVLQQNVLSIVKQKGPMTWKEISDCKPISCNNL